jgi:hypothetical protein
LEEMRAQMMEHAAKGDPAAIERARKLALLP